MKKLKIAFLQQGLGFGGATKSLFLLQQSIKDLYEMYTYTLPYKKDESKIYPAIIWRK